MKRKFETIDKDLYEFNELLKYFDKDEETIYDKRLLVLVNEECKKKINKKFEIYKNLELNKNIEILIEYINEFKKQNNIFNKDYLENCKYLLKKLNDDEDFYDIFQKYNIYDLINL